MSDKHYTVADDTIDSYYSMLGILVPGLTKREYFAALAMQGFLAEGAVSRAHIGEIAESSVQTADALIEALNKESGK